MSDEFNELSVSFDDTPPTNQLLAGLLESTIEEIAVGETGTGKVAVKATFKVTDNPENEELAGKMSWKTYTIGTDTDPHCGDPLTFGKRSTIGYREFRDLIDACGLKGQAKSLGGYCDLLKGQTFLGKYGVRMDKQSGEPRSEMRKPYRVGEKPIYIQDVDETGKVSAPRVAGGSAPVASGSTPPPPPAA